MTERMSPRVAGFLAAEAVSAIGSMATMVVIWGYAAYEFDATPGEVSLYGLSFSIPGVVLGPVAGAVVDRLGPKPTLAASKVIGIVASLLLLTADDFVTMALLAGLHGVAMTFAHPAIQSMPPRLVDDDRLARTNALVSLTDEFALVAGPAVAGIAIALVGFKGAFVVDALTYALGLVVLPLVRLRPVRDHGEEADAFHWKQALEGWRIVVHTPTARRIVICTATVFFLYGIALLAEPLYVRDTLERSESVFAALQTSFGLCLVGGGLLAARLGDRLASFRFVAIGVAGSGVASVLYLGTPYVGVAFLGVAVWGLFTAAISGPSRTVLQRSTPEHAHGRVMAADMLAGNTTMLLGTVFAGPLIAAFGVPRTIAAAGSVALVIGLVMLSAERGRRVGGAAEDGSAVDHGDAVDAQAAAAAGAVPDV
jgi:DHA3 family macrolide efflux protein-like MFS transporter